MTKPLKKEENFRSACWAVGEGHRDRGREQGPRWQSELGAVGAGRQGHSQKQAWARL